MAARRPPDDHNHERLYVKVQREERKVIPPVQLARQEIRMTYLPSEQIVPSIVTTASEGRRQEGRIVGTEVSPLRSQSPVVSQNVKDINGHHDCTTTTTVVELSTTTTTTTTSTSSRQLTVQYKTAMAVQQHEVEIPHAQVLEFFEEQGKSFQGQQQSKALALRPRSARSSSPSPVRQSIGLDHLDNLVKLMEQLSTLRDENLKLKKKCEYLESTKNLLQVKNAVESEIGYLTGYGSLPKSSRSKSKSQGREKGGRPRLGSAEDAKSLDSVETSSDSSPKRPKATLSKRSFSTGSLDIPSDIMEQSEDEIPKKMLSESYEKKGRIPSKGSKSPSAKRKSRKSNWSKIIKVLTRQKLPEDFTIGVKTKKDFQAGAGHIRYGSIGTAKELTVPAIGSLDGRSVDSGVGSGVEAEGLEGQRKSTSSGEPASPPPFTPTLEEKAKAELSSGIWMGPPEWLQEHEEELSSPTSCLEHKELIILKSATNKDEAEKYLQVPMPRRKSSPSLLDHDDKCDSSDGEGYVPLRRSSSHKLRSSQVDISEGKEQILGSPKLGKKLHKAAWGKVVKMVHTRKDSIKKRLIKKSGQRTSDVDQSGGEELSEVDMDDFRYDEQEGPLGRSTPKTSPMAIRQKPREKSMSDSPPTKFSPTMISQMGGSIDVSLLMGGMSDEFSKKWKQWEELQTKRLSTPIKETSDGNESVFPDSIGTVSPEFQKKMEEWERSKSIKSSSRLIEDQPNPDSGEVSPEGVSTPPETHGQTVNIEEIQRKLTDSFNRKMEEWERRKYRRDGSPPLDRKDSSSKPLLRKDERQKSRKSKEEKDREKFERQREREIQRVEREQHKLEKEKIRLEKERLKALEREARIEKMKGRLSQSDLETKFKNPILSPLAEYKVTTDFARKLHEWELRKGQGQSSSVSPATYLEAHHRSLEQGQGSDPSQQKKESIPSTGEEEPVLESVPEPVSEVPTRKLSKGQKPPPLTLMPCSDSPEEVSPGARSRSSLESFGDDTSLTMESMTDSNISSLEKANAQLLEELQEKEMEYATLQYEVQDLTDKLNKARIQHSKDIEQYKKECLAGGPSQPPSPLAMSSQLSDLECKIQELKSFGENLAVTMESIAVCKWQSVEGEENVNTRLMELLEQMRLMLLHASQSEEVYQKTTALHSFEKLYSHAMQLQVQLSNLRLSQIERNKEIMSMKRQLLLQEANNLLLQADITRRETELIKYKQYAKRTSGIKRWNTYGGMEGRVVEGEEAYHIPPYKRFTQVLKSTANRASVACGEDLAEKLELDRSKEGSVPIKTDISSHHPVDSQPSISSAVSLPAQTVNSLDQPQYFAETMEENKPETAEAVDIVTDIVEKPETYETTIVVPTQSVQKEEVCTEKGVEIELMFKLPRDISQHELNVPRSHRDQDKSAAETEGTETDEVMQKSNVPKLEMKFPELLIPEWKKTQKGRLLRLQNIDVSEPEEMSQSDLSDRTVEGSSRDDRSVISEDSSDSIFGSTSDKSPVDVSKENPPQSSDPHKRHTFPRITDTHSETITITKNEEQTSVTDSPLISRRSVETRLHWPRVRQVTSANRIKPAEELLQESRRYRKGQSVYMTRILQKYALHDDSKKTFDEKHQSRDKENLAHGYVKTIVKRLSREGTPDSPSYKSSGSDGTTITIQKADSPKTRSEFVQHIVRKLSSPSGPEQPGRTAAAPLKDLTNGSGHKVKKLAEAFDSARTTPDRTLSDSESQPLKSILVTSKRKNHDIGHTSFESSSSTLTNSQSLNVTDYENQPDSTISTNIVNYSSMPLLSIDEVETPESHNGYRERAATTATCDSNAEHGVKGQTEKQEVHLTISALSDSEIGATSGAGETKTIVSKKTVFPKKPPAPHLEIIFPQKTTQKKSAKVKMGTIGVLCQQTMLSFDLGLSLQAEQQQAQQRRQSEGEDKNLRPLSSGSEEEPASPSSPQSDDKRRQRSKFFETSWLQKPRRFFKVSKC